MNSRKILGWVVLVAGGLYVLLFCFAAYTRLVYPFEVEWNEGAVLDHAIRLLAGKPIYTAPSLTFAPFIYTPLYYYVIAAIMKIGGVGLWAGRAVSIGATLMTAALCSKIVHRETQSNFLAVTGGMLYLAFYHATGFFYDIVRMDALAMLFVIGSIYAALYTRRGYLLAAIGLTLAFFTKQQTVVFVPAIAGWMFLRDRKTALSFAALSIVMIWVGSLILNETTSGWYSYYAFTIPGLKARALFSWMNALNVLPDQLLKALSLSTIVLLIATARHLKTCWRDRDHRLLLGFCYLAGLISATMGSGNAGGYVNVLMPLTAMISILLPIAAQVIAAWIAESTVVTSSPSSLLLHPSSLPAWIMLFQFASLAYNPLSMTMLFGSSKQRAGGEQFITTLRTLPGDVWMPMHGYLNRLAGKPTHIHFMAMNDALIPGDTTSRRFQQEIDSAYARHRFHAILLDENSVFSVDTPRGYHYQQSVLHTPNIFLSRIGDAPTRPQFVFVPNE